MGGGRGCGCGVGDGFLPDIKRTRGWRPPSAAQFRLARECGQHPAGDGVVRGDLANIHPPGFAGLVGAGDGHRHAALAHPPGCGWPPADRAAFPSVGGDPADGLARSPRRSLATTMLWRGRACPKCPTEKLNMSHDDSVLRSMATASWRARVRPLQPLVAGHAGRDRSHPKPTRGARGIVDTRRVTTPRRGPR